MAAAMPARPISPTPRAPKRVQYQVGIVQKSHVDVRGVRVGGHNVISQVVVDGSAEAWVIDRLFEERHADTHHYRTLNLVAGGFGIKSNTSSAGRSNPKPARNQIEGAVVMGVGMALFEETVYDPRFGAPINNNLADYIVATNADSPHIDVTFLDYPDLVLNPLGARGVGEIGLAGIAAAITNAVYHATGVRVRKLPVRIENLLSPSLRA